mgnify:CR=1 FL=1
MKKIQNQKKFFGILAAFALFNLALLGVILLPKMQAKAVTPTSTLSSDPISNTIPVPTNTPTLVETPFIPETPVTNLKPLQTSTDVLIMALADGLNTHLFAYQPLSLPLTRLTDKPWDDRYPALDINGSQVAYTSRANGYWDLFILNLTDGSTRRMTDTPTYDGASSWSPDGQWLVYESYVTDHLDLFLLNTFDPTQAPMQLTADAGSNTMPAWSPQGREIAFVSNRSGNSEIWLARLDQVDDRFSCVSDIFSGEKRAPTWSPDGRYLVWVSEVEGNPSLLLWDSQNPDQSPRMIGSGSLAVFSPDGAQIAAVIRRPNENGLVIYRLETLEIAVPYTRMPGEIFGIDWKSGQAGQLITAGQSADQSLTGPLWTAAETVTPAPPYGRTGLVALENLEAPFPYLQDQVDESFIALRNVVAQQTGWDFLANLENAYIPITQAPSIAQEDLWLYTGRAIVVNSMPLPAKWMAVVREDINGQTYWRVYLKARYQDGSQGVPLSSETWDFTTRSSGDIQAYENGGSSTSVPSGYWIDFTELANRFGWQRLPSLNNWRTYYPSTRFTQFVLTAGLDWEAAMRQVVPPEALATPTPLPSNTPINFRQAAPTATPMQPTGTPRPTWTPLPGSTSP